MAPIRVASRARSGFGPGKSRMTGTCGMLPPREREQLQRLGVERVDPGDDQVDAAPLHPPDGGPVVGRLVDLVAQRLEHRAQQGEDRGLGVDDEDSGLAHGFILSEGRPPEATGAGASSLRE